MTSSPVLRLTSLSHGGGCGCKLAPAVLDRLVRHVGQHVPVPPELLVGIETRDDAAVYRLAPDQAIVATTDFFMPIVDDPFDFGAIAATNALSDVYAMGARPLFALSLLAMPIATLPEAAIARILAGGDAACRRAGVPIAGGHSVDSVEPIYGLVAIGLVDPRRMKRNADARAGDRLVLGKPLGVGIYGAALKKQALTDVQYAELIATTTQLNSAGMALASLEGVHAMTDVTGFGLLGHLLEVCRGSGAGADVRIADVPLLRDARALAASGHLTGGSARNWQSCGEAVDLGACDLVDRALLTDPQTSGGLLVSCAPDAVDAVLDTFVREGFAHAAVIGAMTPGAGIAVR